MFEIIPAIDILDGKCVRLARGEFSDMREYSSDPVSVARSFEDAGLRRLHLVDLDGARMGSFCNLGVLESIARATDLIIDFSGGVRSAADVQLMLDAGAELACIGSIAVKAPDVFAEIVTRFGPARILLAADTRRGRVATDGWTDTSDIGLLSLLRHYIELGGRSALVTDIARDGLLNGPSSHLYVRTLNSIPTLDLIASGGVTTLSDVDELERLGCSGAVVGKAIYEGRISISDLARRTSAREAHC